MAVAQGYGKTVTSGSVFAYDVADTRNCYIGEPTVNQYTNPDFISGTTGWSFASWDGNVTYGTDNVVGPFGEIIPVLKLTKNATSAYSHFHQLNNGKYITGNQYTVSAWVKGFGVLGGRSHWGGNVNFTLTGEWQYVSYTVSATTTSNGNYPYWAAETLTTGTVLYMVYVQSELKSHATPFIAGTRSATQGLLPLVGNSTIDLSNVSFDSNAQMTFDGTNDYTVIGTVGITDYSQPFTMECIFKVDSAATWDNGFRSNIYGIGGSYAGMYGLFKNSNNEVGLQLRDATTTSYATATGLSKGSYYHLVGTWNGSNTMELYVNGVVTQTTSTTKTGATDTSNLYIGGARAYGGSTGNYYQGEIPVVKYYNRALSAGEVRQNYLHYKTRFNLS